MDNDRRMDREDVGTVMVRTGEFRFVNVKNCERGRDLAECDGVSSHNSSKICSCVQIAAKLASSA